MKEAPLYVDSHDFALWALRVFEGSGVLERRIQEDALALLDAIVLALQGFDRGEAVERADGLAALLRGRLRLARDLKRIDDRQLVHASGVLDGIGRQLGGWQRRLAGDTVEPRHR